jgi:hypothetical protein
LNLNDIQDVEALDYSNDDDEEISGNEDDDSDDDGCD